ncbi:MAG: PAC2 family protein [Chloroflexi bacterium]|nr:PAC2 family protein [Chloroflexota bacterium]
MHPDVRVIGEVRPLERPLLIAAFDGRNGSSAVAAVAYLAHHWDAQPVAEIDPDAYFDFTALRPRVRLQDGQRVLDWPDAKFAVARPEGIGRDVVLFVGAEPHLRWHSYAEAFASVADALGVEQTVIVNAYPGGAAHTRPIPMHLVGADEAAAQQFGLPSRSPRYQGPAAFAMSLAIEERGRSRGGFSLTAIAPFYLVGEANPYTVRALVTALDRAIGTRTDLRQIDGRVAEADIALVDAFAAQPDLEQIVRGLEQQYDETMPPAPLPGDPSEVVGEVEAFLRSLGRPDGGLPEGGTRRIE